MKDLEPGIRPEKIAFQKSCMVMWGPKGRKCRISYKDIVLAYIRIPDHDTGCYLEPEITDITGDMEGDLVLYGRQHEKWIIRTDCAGQTAGALLVDLSIHAPYIVVGRADWFDWPEGEDFEMIGQMVEVMRECSRYP